jgi:hypothetical protein
MGTISSLFSQATDVAITNHQGCKPAQPSDSGAEVTSCAASGALGVTQISSARALWAPLGRPLCLRSA